jgi:hypothetical protein
VEQAVTKQPPVEPAHSPLGRAGEPRARACARPTSHGTLRETAWHPTISRDGMILLISGTYAVASRVFDRSHTMPSHAVADVSSSASPASLPPASLAGIPPATGRAGEPRQDRLRGKRARCGKRQARGHRGRDRLPGWPGARETRCVHQARGLGAGRRGRGPRPGRSDYGDSFATKRSSPPLDDSAPPPKLIVCSK